MSEHLKDIAFILIILTRISGVFRDRFFMKMHKSPAVFCSNKVG
ncbi:hypothetical protein LBBP_04400 [Leptospira borgpetersenii serovar Ballum]|uniref:Uncharacterized protein n=1 Tax=Leptospira borgpetersenii serovar Ballum TaxID=280505 RepID=A0A0S2IY11_LEPBO|nr:hypothetical protein LBBP_04400 [Leptospira borgpetersenii serovar Ballum]